MAKVKRTVGVKTGSKAVRGRRGGLKNLPTMPLDILIEVLSYLCSMDILNLARTSKDFRKFLMVRSSEFIWKRARHNIEGFPARPDDLSEPAYANFAFDTHCHVCSSPGARNIMWILRARYCSSCKKQKLVSRTRFRARLGGLTHMSLGDISEFTSVVLIDMYGLCHLPTAERLFDDAATIDDVRQNAKLIKSELDAREKHARLCERWQTAVKYKRQKESSIMRQNRYDEIYAKLMALGWGRELATLKQIESNILSEHPQVNQPKELTEGAWNNMEASLSKVMGEAKMNRIMLSRRTVLMDRIRIYNDWYAQRRHAQGLGIILPLAMNLAIDDKLRDLILEVPDDEEFTKTRFDVLKELVPAWIAEWKTSIAEEIFGAFYPRQGLEVHEYLSLASTAWECRHCSASTPSVLRYPELLDHRCMNRPDTVTRFGCTWEALVKMANQATLWDIGFLAPGHASWWSSEVVEACGMDRRYTTVEEMDELDVRLSCASCDNAPRFHKSPIHAHKVFTWRAAVQHYFEHAAKDNPNHMDGNMAVGLQWTRVPEHFVKHVKAIEKDAIDYYAKYFELPDGSRAGRPYCCAYCPKSSMDQQVALEHIQTAHPGPDNPCPDYYLDRSFGPIEGSPVMLITEPRSIQELTQYAEDGDFVAEEVRDWFDDGRAGFV